MRVISSIPEIRNFIRDLKNSGATIGLVPTMGALHDGHLELARAARKLCDTVIVSVFVNKTQFGQGEDFDAYPRTLESDADLLKADNLADAVFAPTQEEMYPAGDPRTWVTVDRMTDHLCGTSRPGHFRGVATVVTKLFAICHPNVAVFGLKDVQQFFIIKKLTAELNLDVDVRGVETVREPDGLALSSRNQYLSQDERAQATVLFRAVSTARTQIEEGETDASIVRDRMISIISEASLGRLDYAQVVGADDFYPIQSISPGQTVVVAVAVHFGNARLIDNQIIGSF